MRAQPAIGSTFAGHRLESVLGAGGMGVVYRATRLDSEGVVALKLITADLADDPVFAARFRRERRLAAGLAHPHVIPVHEAGDEDGILYLAMKLVDGVDLQAVIAAGGGLHPRHAAEVVGQVASALEAAHSRGLVHRDVKSANVMIEARPGGAHAYLTDFGLSKDVASQSGLTRPGQWVGTMEYASPEQLLAEPVDARTDVYSLGAVLYEALSGQVPFPRPRDVDVFMAHIGEPPPRPSERSARVPAAFDEVVARAMAKTSGERYPSARELADAVREAGRAAPAPERGLTLLRPAAGCSAAGSDPDAPTAA